MRKRILTGVIAVVLAVAGAFATGSVLYAQRAGGEGFGGGFGGFEGRGHGHRPGFALLRGLDLTDQQRQQVRTIMDNHKSEFQQVRQRIRTAFEAQHAAATATPPDEATIRAKATEVGAAQGDLAVLMAKVRGEVFQILTPDQQAKAQQLQAQRAQRAEQRREKMQQFRQQHQQQQQPPAPPEL
jgi:periplasmic protein CpxP/Spy